MLVMVSHTLVILPSYHNNEWIYPSHPLLLFVNKDAPNALKLSSYGILSCEKCEYYPRNEHQMSKSLYIDITFYLFDQWCPYRNQPDAVG